MIYATFCTVSRGDEKYRLYVFADPSKQGLAKKILEFLEPQFDATLQYYSSVKGKKLTREMSNLGIECHNAGMQVKMLTDLMGLVASYPLSHFDAKHFEGSVEFYNGKTALWLTFNPYVEGLAAFLDQADLFLYAHGLWDELPEDFMSYAQEEKAFDVVYKIIADWNNKQRD